MRKITEHTNQIREKCADLHKSGNGCTEIATCLEMPIYTIRAIIQINWNYYKLAWKRTQVYFPPKQRITLGELQKSVASWGHKVPKTTIRRSHHANRLFGRHARKKPFFSFNHKCKVWSLLTLTGRMFYCQMKWELGFLATNTQCGCGVKRKMNPLKITWSYC